MSDDLEWWERPEGSTAADLVKMQEAVEENENLQNQAWTDLQNAIESISELERAHQNAEWSARCAREELAQMVEAIKKPKEDA